MLYYQFAIMGDKVELDELEAWLKHIESQVVPDSLEQYQEFRDKGIVIDVDCFGDMVEDFNPDATVKLNFTGWPRLVD